MFVIAAAHPPVARAIGSYLVAQLSGRLETGVPPNLPRGTKFFGGPIFNRLFLRFRNNASHKQTSRFHCHQLSG